MLKANVGLSRKVSANYNSDGFSVNLEGEIQANLDDPEAVIERIKELFDLAEEALSRQVDRHQSDSAIAARDADPQPGTNAHPNARPAPNGDGHSPRNGHRDEKPQNGEPATNKQVQFLSTLAKRQKLFGAKLERFIEEVVGKACSPYDLTRRRPVPSSTPSTPRPPRTTDLEDKKRARLQGTGDAGTSPSLFHSGGFMQMIADRPHWSYSSISQYLKCPLQYYFERVLRLPRKTISDAQVLGASVHSALAGYHRTLQAREPASAQQVRDDFLTAWEDQVNRFDVAHEKKTPDDNIALGIALIEIYLKEPPPQDIVAVETPILSPIANSRGEVLEKPLLVVPDLITRREDGGPKVVEIKTSGRAFSESEVATSLQPTCYASALHELTGQEPVVEYAVMVKTKVPKFQRIEAVRNTSDFGRLGDILEVVDRSIETGSFYPVESPLNCSGCAYFRECRGWNGPGSSNARDHEVFDTKEAVPCSRR